ncbi:MAG: substrate-binding domain-containing protein, partial [Lachnospiraceae bacterium]|nr:substrate-binding domain-containing protein [Lachnospiraceae bacterium]
MRTKRISCVMMSIMMAATVLAGCGSSSGSSTSASTEAPAADSAAASTSASITADAGADASSTEAAADTASSTADASAAGSVSGEVTAAGSSALLPLAQAAAEDFMTENPDCVITVNGGGSGEGLKQVAEGSVDIGDSDVYAEDKLDADSAKKLIDHAVCTITMAP